jgi:hypothetical protein
VTRLPGLALCLCLLGVVMANLPVLRDGGRSVQGDVLDGRLVHYFLEHGYRWMRREPLHASLWDPPFFHPMQNALAYSDTMVAAVPVYGALRVVGLRPDTSFQLWVMVVMAVAFWATYALARWALALPPLAAALAAFLLAFAGPRLAQMGHPQLLSPHLALAGILLGALAVRDLQGAVPTRHVRANGLLAGALVCLALELYASVYLGWLTGFGLVIAVGAGLVARRERAALRQVAVRGTWGLGAGAALAAMLLVPFVVHYREAAEQLGPRPWSEVSCFLPSPLAWLTPAPESWLYGGLAGLGGADDPCRVEKSLSIGYVTLAASLLGVAIGWRRRPEGRIVALTLLALVLSATSVAGWTLWWGVYQVVPGAIAIRAVGRIVLVALLPAALGLAYLMAHLETTGRRRLAVALAGVCILEQGMTTVHHERNEMRSRITRAAAAIPPSCRAFFLVTEMHPVHTAITAMWAGLSREAASINGHSGSWPPGYPFERLAPGTVDARIGGWVHANGGRPSETCVVHTAVRARLVSADLPRTLVAGQRARVTLVVQNLGPRVWSRERLVRLGAASDVAWGIGRVELPHDVPPEGLVTFAFDIVAPEVPGTIPFVWGIVEEAVEWKTEDLGVGAVTILPGDTPVAGYDEVHLVSADVPRSLAAGQRARVTLVLRNAGSRPWRRAHLMRLGSQEPQDSLQWGLGRVELPHDVGPGALVTMAFEITAPAVPGVYPFSWQMLREGLGWMPPVLRAGTVTVTATRAEAPVSR